MVDLRQDLIDSGVDVPRVVDPFSDQITGASDFAQVEGDKSSQNLFRQFSVFEDIENRKGEQAAVDKARERAGSAVDRDAAQFERATRGFDLSDRQKAGAKSKIGLTRAIAQADRAGSARRGFVDRAKGIRQLGGAFSDVLFGQQASIFTDLANIQGQLEKNRILDEAGKDAARASTIGNVAGFILAMFSSEDYKHKKKPVTGLLKKLEKVRVENWQYKGGDGRKHVGAYAEEFNETFGVGQAHPDKISVVDIMGVTLGAVKELDAKLEAFA